MTEEEAKTKWCPFTRVTTANRDGSGSRPRNRVVEVSAGQVERELSENLAGTSCIASACMAWRWAGREDLSRLELEARIHRPEVVYMVQRRMSDQREAQHIDGPSGFCGLAGKEGA